LHVNLPEVARNAGRSMCRLEARLYAVGAAPVGVVGGAGFEAGAGGGVALALLAGAAFFAPPWAAAALRS
jgi:hypothetical protein